MEQLVGHFVELFNTHFDLSFMLCVNVLTYTYSEFAQIKLAELNKPDEK